MVLTINSYVKLIKKKEKTETNENLYLNFFLKLRVFI
jgi:hypothetical protein